MNEENIKKILEVNVGARHKKESGDLDRYF